MLRNHAQLQIRGRHCGGLACSLNCCTAVLNRVQVPKLQRQITDLLKEGVLHEEYVLDNVMNLKHIMREANVTLRWIMLHTYDKSVSWCPCILAQSRVRGVAERN